MAQAYKGDVVTIGTSSNAKLLHGAKGKFEISILGTEDPVVVTGEQLMSTFKKGTASRLLRWVLNSTITPIGNSVLIYHNGGTDTDSAQATHTLQRSGQTRQQVPSNDFSIIEAIFGKMKLIQEDGSGTVLNEVILTGEDCIFPMRIDDGNNEEVFFESVGNSVIQYSNNS